MNNKTSIYLNVILVIAVAVLYYLHFSSAGASGASDKNDSAAVKKPVVLMPKDIKNSKIVYVNVDVINEKYNMLIDFSKEIQGQQQRLQNAYQNKAQKLQQDYAELQQKMSQGLLSENQSTAAQKDIMKRKEELDGMEAKLQELVDRTQRKNEEIRKTVVDYLAEYNKNTNYDYILTYTNGPGGFIVLANDSMDITNDVIEGLNAQYNKEKKEKK